MPKPEYPSTWEAILSKIPTALHDVVKPALQEWDQGVNKRFQELAEEWAPFKEFKEGKVDPNYLKNALSFAQAFENDPTGVLKNANETYSLGFADPDERARLEAELESFGADDDDNDFDEDDDTVVDLASDPNFKALQDQISKMSDAISGLSQETDAQKHEKYLDNLLKDKQHINRTFITALMTQGLTGEQAIDEYNKALASSVQTPTDGETPPVGTPGTAPVVMGPDGTAGAGTETKEIDFGKMGTTDVNDMVAQMLQAAQGNE